MSILINDTQFNLLSGQIMNTGQNLMNATNSLSGFVNNTSRISSINVTGLGAKTGVINMSGLGSVVVLTGANNFIYISGSTIGASSNSDGINLSGNLYFTGSNLYNLIQNYTEIGITGRGTINYIPIFTNNGSGVVNSNILRLDDTRTMITGTSLVVTGILLQQLTSSRAHSMYMDPNSSNFYIRSDPASRTYIGTAGKDILFLDNLGSNVRYAVKANGSTTWGIDLGGTAAGESFHNLYIINIVGTGNIDFINNQNITGMRMSGSNIGINPNPLAFPISQLDVSGHIVAMNVTGNNIKVNNILVSSGIVISGNPPNSFNSIGYSGQISISGNQLLICTGNNLWGRITISPF